MKKSNAIELKNLIKTYGDVYALNDVDLNISDGEYFVLLGPSGGGKTTLLRSIGGFIRPDSGTVEIKGKNVNNLPVAGSFSGFRLIDGGCDSWKEKKVPHTWSPIPGNLFQVRGPNYMVDQIKVASSYSIFEPTAVEVFDAPCTLDFPADHFYQNKVPSTGNTNGVPKLHVDNQSLPQEIH